jgi:hypothetical protein
MGKKKELAPGFKRYDARVQKFSHAVYGKTTTVACVDGSVCALFAPDMHQLENFWNRLVPFPIDKKLVRNVMFFQSKAVSQKRKRPTARRGEGR